MGLELEALVGVWMTGGGHRIREQALLGRNRDGLIEGCSGKRVLRALLELTVLAFGSGRD